jgi:hypothetical protein
LRAGREGDDTLQVLVAAQTADPGSHSLSLYRGEALVAQERGVSLDRPVAWLDGVGRQVSRPFLLQGANRTLLSFRLMSCRWLGTIFHLDS